MLRYGTLVGIYARWHPFLFDISAKLGLGGAAGRNYLMSYVNERIKQRKEERRSEKDGDKERTGPRDENAPMDFLDKLMTANEKDPDKVTTYHVFMMGVSNIIAGSDTTAVSLSSILYNLLKQPQTMEKLRKEIQEYERQGRCGNPNISFKQSQEMPYLQAVMKEALRMHPATGLPMWREVPEEGVEICGRFFPAGTLVGINSWCAHYNREIFGQDADVFRPERWLEAEQEGGEQFKAMEGYWMPFGLGSRTCIGRHISFLEMSKLIPQIVRRFDFQLENPDKEWQTENNWFVKPTDFRVRVQLRQQP